MARARSLRRAGQGFTACADKFAHELLFPHTGNPGYFYQGVAPALKREGDVLQVLDVLARDVGVMGVFSDWPATVSFYAHCKGLP